MCRKTQLVYYPLSAYSERNNRPCWCSFPAIQFLTLSLELQSDNRTIPAGVMVVMISFINYRLPDRMLGEYSSLVHQLGSIQIKNISPSLRPPGWQSLCACSLITPSSNICIHYAETLFSLCLWFPHGIKEQKSWKSITQKFLHQMGPNIDSGFKWIICWLSIARGVSEMLMGETCCSSVTRTKGKSWGRASLV